MKLQVDLTLSVEQLAQAFCELDDERQAQFFVEVGKIAETWDGSTFPQWLLVGRHLKECECSTDKAREIVLDIADGVRGS